MREHGIPMSRTAAALPILFSVSLLACKSGPLGSYESCLREPSAYREGRSREGFTTTQGGFWWLDWEGTGVRPRDPVLTVTLTKKDCLYSIRAEGAEARWAQGGFTYLDDMSFHQDRSGRRLGFVAFDAAGAYAVIDGVKSPPYEKILWRPSFSPSGRRSGYLAKTASGAVAVVDGQIVARERGFHEGLFEVLDDGRFAAAPKREDGMYEVVLDTMRTAPFTDLCRATIRPSGRSAVVGKLGDTYVTFIDGQEIQAPGIPGRCEVTFAPDDSRWGWIALHTGPGGVKSEEAAAVIDGKVHPLPTSVAELHFIAGLAVVRTSTADPSGYTIHGARKWEKTHWLVDLQTPAVPPTKDDYSPVDNGWTVEWTRVKIGDSVGPRFDQVDWNTLFVDAQGKVHYTGERRGQRMEVIDNVLIAPGQGRSPATLNVPDAPPAPDGQR